MRFIKALIIPGILLVVAIVVTSLTLVCQYLEKTYSLGISMGFLVAFFLILSYILGYIASGDM